MSTRLLSFVIAAALFPLAVSAQQARDPSSVPVDPSSQKSETYRTPDGPLTACLELPYCLTLERFWAVMPLSSGLRFHELTPRIPSSLGVQEIRESSEVLKTSHQLVLGQQALPGMVCNPGGVVVECLGEALGEQCRSWSEQAIGALSHR